MIKFIKMVSVVFSTAHFIMRVRSECVNFNSIRLSWIQMFELHHIKQF